MPEGDTIYRLAAKLRPILAGQTVVEVDCDLAAVDDWQVLGRVIERIESRGKNLLIHCAPLHVVTGKPDPREPAQLRVVIWTHLGMDGSWQLRARAERLARSQTIALALYTETHVAACSRPKHLAFLGPRGVLRNPMLAKLGPDLLDPDADLDEAVVRLRMLGQTELGVAIAWQSAVAGIGNVYKSELLFLARQSPFTSVDALDPAVLRALLERARGLLRANVEAGGPRRTRLDRDTIDERVWVYDRSGRPCYTCGTTIEMRRQGDLGRSTYFCPLCQAL